MLRNNKTTVKWSRKFVDKVKEIIEFESKEYGSLMKAKIFFAINVIEFITFIIFVANFIRAFYKVFWVECCVSLIKKYGYDLASSAILTVVLVCLIVITTILLIQFGLLLIRKVMNFNSELSYKKFWLGSLLAVIEIITVILFFVL